MENIKQEEMYKDPIQKEGIIECIDLIGTEFADRFMISLDNRSIIREFMDKASKIDGCALCIGIDEEQILADVFIMRNCQVCWRHELSSRSDEYKLLKHHGYLD
jgi:hypothetical protein